MARTIRWADVAVDDLSEAAEFIARDSPFYARTLVREARSAGRSLKVLAERGHIVPETDDPTVRELFVSSYRLIYKVGEDTVCILAFVHGARDLAALWRKRNT